MHSSVEEEKTEEVTGEARDSDKDGGGHSSDGGQEAAEEESMEVSNEPPRPQRRMLDSGSDSDD